MKNFKKLGMKGIALVLCLMMVVSLLPTTAFAADETDGTKAAEPAEGSGDANLTGDGEGDDKDETKEITPAEGSAYVDKAEAAASENPEDNTFNKTPTPIPGGTKTETDWNYTDEGRIEEENDKLKEEGTFDYSDKTVVDVDDDDPDTVDKLLDELKKENPDLDSIENGTYTKHEEQTRQEVTNVTVTGGQTSNDTFYDDGNSASSSHDLTGSQTTTLETTTTTKETTTTVTKETGKDEVTSDRISDEKEGEPEKTHTEEVTKGTETTGKSDKADLDEVKVTLGTDLFNDKDVTSDELTVSEGTKKASDKNNVATTENLDNVSRDLLKALDGWTVDLGNDQKVTIKVVDGVPTYVDANDNVVPGIKVEAKKQADGSYSITATKSKVLTDTGDVKPFEGEYDDYVYTKTESGFEWGGEKYEYVGTDTDEDGNVVTTYVKYVKKGDTTRTDTEEFITITTRTDGVKEIEQTATVSATLTNGKYDVEATWNGVTGEAKDNGTRIVKVLGPSGDVIGYAIESSKSGTIGHHLVIANAYKDEDKNIIAGTGNFDGEDLTLEGVVMQSTVYIQDAAGGSRGAWLRKLDDGHGGYVYVYCAEHGKATPEGEEYDIVNVKDHALYSENAAHIQYVVENGWWGTNSGTGSLAAVKALISSSGYADYLDEGIALAATQAAIWYYTASTNSEGKPNTIPDTNVFTNTWTKTDGTKAELSVNEKAAAMALFNALIAKDQNVSSKVKNTTDLITEEDILSTSVQVLGKVDITGVDQAAKAAQKDQYNANVSVTLAVVPSRLNSDNMIVIVYSNGVEVGRKNVDAETMAVNGETSKVTIENVKLTSGEEITFELTGTQKLTEGAYLFSTDINTDGSTKSQTMVGYVDSNVSGNVSKHDVKLTVSMDFTVTKTNGSATEGVSVTGETTAYQEIHKFTDSEKYDVEVNEHHETEVTVTTIVKTEYTDETTEAEEVVYWEEHTSDYYEYPTEGDDDDDDDEPELPEPETPLGEEPEEDDDVELPDPETPLGELPDEEIELDEPDIPLADVPATGEASGVWYAMTALSAAGLVCLVTYERKKRSEETDA